MKKVIAIGLMGALLITSPIYSTVAFSATLPTENPTVQTDPTLTETPVENPEQVAAELDEEHYATIAGTKVLLYPNQQKATLDGISTPLAAAPYVDYDTTMIPLRFIAQDVLKAQVLWNQQTQDVTITKDGKVVILKTKTGKVLVDGTEKPMPKPPVVKGDYTFVPLRLVAEIFGCRVGYENTPQERVTIQTPDLKVERPHASVTLPTKITAGQALTAQDNSSDPNGLAITAHHWQITLPGEQPVGTTDLAAAFKRPTPGVYELAYTVCNEKGAWSQPFSTQLEVLLNSAPVISRLTADNSHPSIGQTVDFQYTTSNEEWEEITETRWEFSYLSAGKVVVKPEKPRAFFAAGNYTVQLSVKDSYGNWSLPQTTVVNVDSHKMASEANYKFNALIPGEIFLNQARFNFNELDTVVPTVTQPTGTTLIASNNPEKVPSKGILYSDRATGNVRLRYHHENNSNQLLEIMMLAQNKTDKPITLVVKKTGFSGPTTNAMQAGYKVIENYLTSITINQTIVLAPNEIYQINEVRGKLQQGEIVSAIIDVTCDGVLDFTMAALGDTNKPADVKYLSQLPKIKTHVRGTFTNADLLLDYQYAGQKASKIIIGRDDAFAGYFLHGVDATSGTAIENSGARAVTHTITIHNNGNEKVGLLINPRGLIFRGVIECAGEIVNISNQGLINDSAEAAVIATFEPNETKTLRYLPPSGSDTPILLVLLPESQWKNF